MSGPLTQEITHDGVWFKRVESCIDLVFVGLEPAGDALICRFYDWRTPGQEKRITLRKEEAIKLAQAIRELS